MYNTYEQHFCCPLVDANSLKGIPMKLTLSNITSRYASVAALNANFQAIITALENTLSRDGTSPNTMAASLDMDSNRIINVADPVNAGDVVTKGWLEATPGNAAADAADAAASAAAALASEVAAEAAADTIVGWDFIGQWTTATAYVVNNIVTVPSGAYQGWSFICLVAHTAGGTFATDYSGGKWEVFAQRGATGVGTGDMLAANNLSDVASVSSARTNLGLTALATTTPGANVATFLATPSSANLRATLTDETGTGAAVFADSPTLVTPALGTPASGTLTNCVNATVSGTVQATTSGTSFDFTGIPTGVKRITVSFYNVSLSGSDDILVQLGDSGGIEATGYISACSGTDGSTGGVASSTSGLIIAITDAARAFSGSVVITLVDASTYTFSSTVCGKITSGLVVMGGGEKSLSAELDRVRITRTGSDTFDLGKVNILYER